MQNSMLKLRNTLPQNVYLLSCMAILSALAVVTLQILAFRTWVTPPSPPFNCSLEIISQTQTIAKLKNALQSLGERLRDSTSFLQLKDTKEQGTTSADYDRTWFMSSLRGHPLDGDPETFVFPSEESKGRLLCIQGRDTGDGTNNRYAFAWKDYLPYNSTLLPGLTFVADNYWDYTNPWHGMSALVSFVAWSVQHQCARPHRMVLYHWGELVTKMGSWISSLVEASLGVSLVPNPLDYRQDTVCFEQAIVQRRGIGGMSLKKLNFLFDTIRCNVRKFCHIQGGRHWNDGPLVINITLVMRSGARGFKNESGLAAVIERICGLVSGCKFSAVHIANLSFCEQVKLMSQTDILITAHGAQLTNMMFMSKGGSVMEMYPKGWLEYAGNGQYIYRWFADWTGLYHEGSWRDAEGLECPYSSTEQLKCFFFYKDNQVGHNETHLTIWTSEVIKKVIERLKVGGVTTSNSHASECLCDYKV